MDCQIHKGNTADKDGNPRKIGGLTKAHRGQHKATHKKNTTHHRGRHAGEKITAFFYHKNNLSFVDFASRTSYTLFATKQGVLYFFIPIIERQAPKIQGADDGCCSLQNILADLFGREPHG